MIENEISESSDAKEYVGLSDFVAEGDEQVHVLQMMIAFQNKDCTAMSE